MPARSKIATIYLEGTHKHLFLFKRRASTSRKSWCRKLHWPLVISIVVYPRCHWHGRVLSSQWHNEACVAIACSRRRKDRRAVVLSIPKHCCSIKGVMPQKMSSVHGPAILKLLTGQKQVDRPKSSFKLDPLDGSFRSASSHSWSPFHCCGQFRSKVSDAVWALVVAKKPALSSGKTIKVLNLVAPHIALMVLSHSLLISLVLSMLVTIFAPAVSPRSLEGVGLRCCTLIEVLIIFEDESRQVCFV